MNRPILITTFQPWRVHQRSNSSDDLVSAAYDRGLLPQSAAWLRHVPVSFDLAPVRVESEVMRLRPGAVICCGMAETRSRLSIETQAKRLPSDADLSNSACESSFQMSSFGVSGDKHAEALSGYGGTGTMRTSADINALMADTVLSEVSEDAGTYVCNHLYYNVLDLADRVSWTMMGVFIHIPIVTFSNRDFLVRDFALIVDRIAKNNG